MCATPVAPSLTDVEHPDAPRWSEADVPADSIYWLFPRSAARRIVAADESPVDHDTDYCSYLRMTVSRTRTHDPIASVTGRDGEPVEGVGDAARFGISPMGDGTEGWLDFAVGDTVFELMVLGDDLTEGGVPLDRMRAATIEIARTVIANLQH